MTIDPPAGFDTHSGADHPVVTNPEEVERVLQRDVAPKERSTFRSELDAAAPYVGLDRLALRSRIQLAMLFHAKGDLSKLREARAVADSDWRYLLTMTEYADSLTAPKDATPEAKSAAQRKQVAYMAEWRADSDR